MPNGLEGLFKNKLLLQYLAGAGADIGAGRPIGENVSAVTNQAITAQNFNKILSKMLGGNMPEGGEFKLDSKGTTIKIPRELAGAEGTDKGPGQATQPQQPQVSQQPQQMNQGIDWSFLNPSSSSAISGADLAGLTPEMISQALKFKFADEEFKQKKVTDLAEMIYKAALTEQAYASAENYRRVDAPESVFASNVPGYGNLTLEQYKAIPTEDRRYITHVLSARERGEEPMSREAFDSIGDKERHPASAEAAAIDQLYEEYNGRPPQKEIKRIHDLYKPEPQEKIPSPMTWTTAMNQVDEVYGRWDEASNKWFVPPELAAKRDLAQKVLVSLKEQGGEPQRSIVEATEISNKYYKLLEEVVTEAGKIKDPSRRKAYIETQTKNIKLSFQQNFGFVPGE